MSRPSQRCPTCGAETAPPTHGTVPEEVMALMPAPKGVTIKTEGGGLVLERRWFGHQVWFLLAFCLFWDGFLVVWYAGALHGLASGQGDGLFLLLFPLLHVAAGVSLTWYALATLLNKTRIQVRSGWLEVQHGPVPWPRPPKLAVSSLDQLYAVLKRGNKGSRSYELHARQKDGTGHKLLGNLPSPDLVRFLEQRLESHLDIEDRPIANEMPR